MQNSNFLCYDSLFSTRLRHLIAEKKISMQTLSSEIGVSRQAISQYCDGSTVPNADKLLKIAEYFNVSLDYLCGRSEAATTNKDLQFICDYTGLSEKAVLTLHNAQHNNCKFTTDFVNDFISMHAEDLAFLSNVYNVNFHKAIEAKAKYLYVENSEEKENSAYNACKYELMCEINKINFCERFVELLNISLQGLDEEAEKQLKNDVKYQEIKHIVRITGGIENGND